MTVNESPRSSTISLAARRAGSQLARRVSGGVIAENHVQQENGHLWVLRLRKDALAPQTGIDHGVGTSDREFIGAHVHKGMLHASERIG